MVENKLWNFADLGADRIILNAMDILEKLDEKDKKGSKRGAFYYMFNKEKYDHLLEQGFYFSL